MRTCTPLANLASSALSQPSETGAWMTTHWPPGWRAGPARQSRADRRRGRWPSTTRACTRTRRRVWTRPARSSRPSREFEGEGDAVQGAGAEVVFALGREGGDGHGHQVTQALDVG